MKRVITLASVLLLTLFITGCPNTRTPMPSPITDKLIQNRIAQITTLVNDYDSAMSSDDLPKAKAKRDALIFLCISLINDNYDNFEDSLFTDRATANVAGDFAELSLTALTGFTNGERVKSILGIVATAVKGARKSVDVNFFRERTTEIICLKMRAARDRVRANIYTGLNSPASEYPLGAAIDDLVDYLHAGSVNTALLELAQDSGEDGKQAARDVQDAKVSRYLTAAVAIEFRAIRNAAEALRSRLLNPATAEDAKTEIRAVLGQLYEPDELPDIGTMDRAGLFQKLQDKIEKSRDDDSLRKKLMKALKLAP